MESSDAPPGEYRSEVQLEEALPWNGPCDCLLTRDLFAKLGFLQHRGLQLYRPAICPESGILVVRGTVPTYYVRQLVISAMKRFGVLIKCNLAVTSYSTPA